MSCAYEDRAGAYVLGALSSAERLEFEQHLAGCASCARSVRELAGLPGLLATVSPTVLEHAGEEHPLPASLLPALLADVRRTRRRRGLVLLGAAAATVAVLVPVGVVLAHDDAAPAASVVADGRAMTALGDVPVQARLAVEPVAWGTRLDLTCTYARRAGYHLPPSVTYGLYVQTREGGTEKVGTWRALDGRTMKVTAATATDAADIRAVEVRTADGRPVLTVSP